MKICHIFTDTLPPSLNHRKLLTLPFKHTHTCAHIDLPTCTINLKGITKVRAASLRTLTLLLWSLLPCITTSSYPSPSFSIRHCHQLSHDASTQRHTDTPGSIIYLLNLQAVSADFKRTCGRLVSMFHHIHKKACNLPWHDLATYT